MMIYYYNSFTNNTSFYGVDTQRSEMVSMYVQCSMPNAVEMMREREGIANGIHGEKKKTKKIYKK